LGQCVATKPQRIRRHDDVVAEVSNKTRDASYMNIIYREETFTLDAGERLCPDLVVVTGSIGYIIDVTVRYEDEGTMAAAAADKIGKYDPLRSVVSRLHPEVGDVVVVPVVLGSRGCVPTETRGLCSISNLLLTRFGP
jgi:hypothetical protein